MNNWKEREKELFLKYPATSLIEIAVFVLLVVHMLGDLVG